MKAATPPELQYYLEDSFQKITLYSNKVTKATYKEIGSGNYEVTIEVESTKNYYDGSGKLTGTGTKPNLLEIAVFEADTKNKAGMTVKAPLVIEKVWVKPGKSTFKYTTKKLPVKAGIDPYNKMIDRMPDDNLLPLEEATK
jgi:ABC-2 type transport system permease protein